MRALIFDFDGLIIDTETLTANIAMQLVAERGGTSQFSDWAPLFGSTGPESDAAWARTLTDVLGSETDATEFDAVLTSRLRPLIHDLQPLPGDLEVINAARERDWKIGLATGHEGTALVETLKRLRLHERFDVVVHSADVARPKPAPNIYSETARLLQLDPADCLVLEDSLSGYKPLVQQA
jgi:HAD superfamily hydrolase (TIGR01509 family)